MRSCTAVFALSLLLLAPVVSGAQVVRGTVVDLGGQPVAGVVVLLLDSTASVAARALSDAGGVFRIASS